MYKSHKLNSEKQPNLSRLGSNLHTYLLQSTISGSQISLEGIRNFLMPSYFSGSHLNLQSFHSCGGAFVIVTVAMTKRPNTDHTRYYIRTGQQRKDCRYLKQPQVGRHYLFSLILKAKISQLLKLHNILHNAIFILSKGQSNKSIHTFNERMK